MLHVDNEQMLVRLYWDHEKELGTNAYRFKSLIETKQTCRRAMDVRGASNICNPASCNTAF